MDALSSKDVQFWSLQELQNWLKNVGMTDCIPFLAEKNITSGQSLLKLTEEDVMIWTELPLLARRQILQLIHGSRRTRRYSHKDTKIKGIFETLSRRKKSAPLPIPADYGPPLMPLEITLPKQNSSVILVDSSDIQANIPLAIDQTNDWGSEFSDSDTEASDLSKVSKPIRPRHKPVNDHTMTHGCSLLNEPFSKHPHVHGLSENISQKFPLVMEDNIYEQPDREGDNQGKVWKKVPFVQYDSLHGQRSTDFYAPSSGECNKTLCRETLSYRQAEGLLSTGHRSINAKEVADKLNILLANRPAGPDNFPPPSPSNHLLRNSTLSYTNNTAQLPLSQQTTSGLQRGVSQDPLQSFSWFHGDIDRAEAKFRLENDATDGAFLIRKSQKGAQKFASPYSLSLMSSGKVYHLTIRLRPQDSTYALGFEKPGEQTFGTVKELVEHHLINPVYLTECDRGVLLSFV